MVNNYTKNENGLSIESELFLNTDGFLFDENIKRLNDDGYYLYTNYENILFDEGLMSMFGGAINCLKDLLSGIKDRKKTLDFLYKNEDNDDFMYLTKYSDYELFDYIYENYDFETLHELSKEIIPFEEYITTGYGQGDKMTVIILKTIEYSTNHENIDNYCWDSPLSFYVKINDDIYTDTYFFSSEYLSDVEKIKNQFIEHLKTENKYNEEEIKEVKEYFEKNHTEIKHN